MLLLLFLLLTMQVGDQRIKVTTPSDFPAQADGELWLQPDYGRVRWHDAETGAALLLNGGGTAPVRTP